MDDHNPFQVGAPRPQVDMNTYVYYAWEVIDVSSV